MSQSSLPHGPNTSSADVPYTWVITENTSLPNDMSRRVATVGPPGAEKSVPLMAVIQNGQRFSLVTPVGEVLYTGYIYGEYMGREPLAEFGWQNGCTKIEFETDETALI